MEHRSFARTLLWRNNHTQGTLFAVYQKFRQALDAQCLFDDVFATFHARITLYSVGYCTVADLPGGGGGGGLGGLNPPPPPPWAAK